MEVTVSHYLPGRVRLHVPELARKAALAEAALAWLRLVSGRARSRRISSMPDRPGSIQHDDRNRPRRIVLRRSASNTCQGRRNNQVEVLSHMRANCEHRSRPRKRMFVDFRNARPPWAPTLPLQ
jgi:hypothetical protein